MSANFVEDIEERRVFLEDRRAEKSWLWTITRVQDLMVP